MPRPLPAFLWRCLGATGVLLLFLGARAGRADDEYYNARHPSERSSSGKGSGVVRAYSLEERIRYQLWDYTWNPNPDEPITRIKISLGDQRVYVYQNNALAAESPVTTGKPGHETPTGHYSIIKKDIDHKSNLYGLIEDANGNVVSGDAKAGDPLPPGDVYDSADMPYYMRLRDDGVGMHGGYIPGTGPASHGCIRLPHAFAELLYSNVSEGTPVDIVP
jgi:lipoprotein-anchoring transpeptidase ErfK/SrfK